MKRATDLEMTTVGDIVRLIGSESVGVALQELTGLTDPLEVAFVVASVMNGLKRPYAQDIVTELRALVNEQERA